jgi:hypothetical protein
MNVCGFAVSMRSVIVRVYAPCVCAHTCDDVGNCVCMCVYVYLCVCAYTHTYIYKHTDIHALYLNGKPCEDVNTSMYAQKKCQHIVCVNVCVNRYVHTYRRLQ